MLCVPSRRACQVFNHAKSLGDILSNFNEGRLSCPSIAMYIKDFCHSIMAEILYVHGLHLVEPRCKRNRSTALIFSIGILVAFPTKRWGDGLVKLPISAVQAAVSCI
jgi:hypothetical protein